jgi:hypothetical protein
VSQTDSSIVLVGARRSSPGMRDVQPEEALVGAEDEEEPMVPETRGAREDDEAGAGRWSRGSSKSLRSAGEGLVVLLQAGDLGGRAGGRYRHRDL